LLQQDFAGLMPFLLPSQER